MNKAGKISTLVVGTMAVVGTLYATVKDARNRINSVVGIENSENVKNPTTEQTAEKLIITANTNPNTDGNGKDPEKLTDGGKPSVTFDKNGKIETNTNPHLSTNDVNNFNQIPVNHAILPLVRKYITEIANDTKIHPTDKLKLERDAILLAHTMYNTEIKRVAVSDFQVRYGEYKENFEDFTSDSQSLTQAWKSITNLADKVANPKATTETDDFDPFASNSEDDLAESEEMLKNAKAELQKSIADKNATREKVIANAKQYVKAGGNPADLHKWEETCKMLNITPDDLD